MSKETKSSNEARVLAFFKRFPRLAEHFQPSQVSKISIRGIDVKLLKESARYVATCGFVRNTFIEESLGRKILIFDQQWNLLGQVGKKTVHRCRRREWILGIIPYMKAECYEEVMFEETIGEALERLHSTAHYIVGSIVDEDGMMRLMLTSPGKDRSIESILREECRRAETEIVGELFDIGLTA